MQQKSLACYMLFFFPDVINFIIIYMKRLVEVLSLNSLVLNLRTTKNVDIVKDDIKNCKRRIS